MHFILPASKMAHRGEWHFHFRSCGALDCWKFTIESEHCSIDWFMGKIQENPMIFMGKSMVSCRCSLKVNPLNWVPRMQMNYRIKPALQRLAHETFLQVEKNHAVHHFSASNGDFRKFRWDFCKCRSARAGSCMFAFKLPRLQLEAVAFWPVTTKAEPKKHIWIIWFGFPPR